MHWKVNKNFLLKKPVDRASWKPVNRRSTGRLTGVDFEIYQSGRVEKIPTGSISGHESALQNPKTGQIISNFKNNNQIVVDYRQEKPSSSFTLHDPQTT